MSGMRPETRERYEKIYKLYLSGKSKKEIAEGYHYAYSTIDRAMREHGVTFSHGSFAEHRDEILKMYKNGGTYQEIAEATGLNESTISRNLRHMLLKKDKEEHRHRRDKKNGRRRSSGRQQGRKRKRSCRGSMHRPGNDR